MTICAHRWRLVLLLLLLAAPLPAAEGPWVGQDASGGPVVELYFFWSDRCPHCAEARPFVRTLAGRHPWLRLHSLEVTGSRDNARRYAELAARLGEEAASVPAFLFCGEMITGYDRPGGIGAVLEGRLTACHQRLLAGGPVVQPAPQPQPELARGRSLAAVTVLLAGMDAFNPCAFFVLLFLLSVLVHAGSRARMLLVGGVFVFFSGALYFVFMAAWLNLFLMLQGLEVVTALAGMVAVGMAALNIKDYLRPGEGPSLSIPDGAKPGLFQRMQGLLHADRLPALLTGAAVLAAAANSYELLCTSGFPMVYTRILTLRGLPAGEYYLYLLFYNLVYVLPLALIVLMFTWTLGRRKLREHEGRLLKLLSGLMMLGLGLVLLVAPAWLDRLGTAVGLLAAAIGVTALAWLWERGRRTTGTG